ncbi:MAG: hypothetical protein R3301_13605, partial [Saprospiraceae bacterium]|nr:hypothetical protein [Saprospiraceae bacterium]
MLLLVLSGWKVFAQSLAIPTWDRPDIRLDQSSGLTDLYVKDYLQDQYGFVWIAAHQAVQRFDGMSVRPLFLGNDDADMLFVGLEEDRKRHHLWVASLQALYQVDLSTMQVLQKLNSDSHAQWQGGHVLSVYLDDSDRLWIGKNEGFSMIDLNSGELQSGTFHFPGLSTSSLQFARQVYAMIQDPHDPDVLWFGTAAGLVKYNHRQDSATRFSNQTFGCTRTATIHHVFYCPQTNTIVHSNDTQTGKPVTCNFLVFDLTTESYVASVSLQPEWKSRGIYAADRDRLWLSTDQGTAVYHVADDRVEEILTSPEQEFPARVDYVDANGKIWSTGTRAIHIYDGKPPAVQHYYYNTDRPKGYHVCSDLLVDGQSVYMSVYGGDGLYVLDLPTGTWRVLTPPDHQDQPATAFMGTGLERALDGSIIALSNQGIYRVNSGADALVPLTNLPGYGEGIIDRNGILWTYQSNALVRNHLVQGVLESFPAETSDCVNRRRAFRPRTDHMGNLWFLGICEGFIYYP